MIKNYKYVFLSLLAIFLMAEPLLATGPSKFEKLAKLNKPKRSKTDFSKYLKNSKNEVEATAAILFIGYKDFLSSQDMNSCVFTPSCSVYAIETVRNNNLFIAYMKVFDRLSRCHPLVAKGEYPYNFENQTYYDPIH